jgi:thioesterase domain-containing protein/acyl carrier protein
MSELSEKLQRLGDAERVRLYNDLVDQLGAPLPQSVHELVLLYEKGSAVDTKVIQRSAGDLLPENERPTRFIEVDRLPRTSHGKLDRRGLPGLIRAAQPPTDRSVDSDAPSDEAIAAVIAAFTNVLGSPAVGPDSNFFEIGGHSLLAVECMLELENRTGQRVSITQFLNHPTPRGVAAILKRQSQQSFGYVYPVSENLIGLPVFVFSSSRLAYALKRYRPDWTIYGIQLRWRDDRDEEIEYRSLKEMATYIAAEINELSAGKRFVLAGSSFPAMVAFEVARQLHAINKTPLLTILIEPSLCYGIRTWLELDLARHGRLREGKNHYLQWLAMNNPFRAQFWRRLNQVSPFGRINRPSGNDERSARDQHATYEQDRTIVLWRNYRPSYYAGPAVLLAGSEHSWQVRENWQRWLHDGCSVHTLNADHVGILKDPFMSEAVVPIVMSEVDSLLA